MKSLQHFIKEYKVEDTVLKNGYAGELKGFKIYRKGKPLFKTKREVAHSQRAELLETIITKINAERVGTKYKPVTPIMIAVKLKGITTGDLVGFVKLCTQAKSFGQCFFGKLKKKEKN